MAIGASVVLLALLDCLSCSRRAIDQSFASGTICAVGTLGILIPPSIMLVLMADRMAMSVGAFLRRSFSGISSTSLYIIYIILFGLLQSEKAPAATQEQFIELICTTCVIHPASFIPNRCGSWKHFWHRHTDRSSRSRRLSSLLTFINKKFESSMLKESFKKPLEQPLSSSQFYWELPHFLWYFADWVEMN